MDIRTFDCVGSLLSSVDCNKKCNIHKLLLVITATYAVFLAGVLHRDKNVYAV